MMAFLQFTFASGWHFFGVLLLIGAVLDGLKDIALALPRRGPSASSVRSVVSAPRPSSNLKEMEN